MNTHHCWILLQQVFSSLEISQAQFQLIQMTPSALLNLPHHTFQILFGQTIHIILVLNLGFMTVVPLLKRRDQVIFFQMSPTLRPWRNFNCLGRASAPSSDIFQNKHLKYHFLDYEQYRNALLHSLSKFRIIIARYESYFFLIISLVFEQKKTLFPFGVFITKKKWKSSMKPLPNSILWVINFCFSSNANGMYGQYCTWAGRRKWKNRDW